ncbi:CalpB, partial [Symbiodinium sp. CCMP2592]
MAEDLALPLARQTPDWATEPCHDQYRSCELDPGQAGDREQDHESPMFAVDMDSMPIRACYPLRAAVVQAKQQWYSERAEQNYSFPPSGMVLHLSDADCGKLQRENGDIYWAHLMSAIIDGTEQVRDDGLVEGHAYSLLFALEVPTLRGTMRMLMLRNPWGGDKEWKGRWSDNHPLWSQHQEVKSKLRPKFENDGVFWMQWEDFQSIFDSVHICQKSMLEGEALRRFRAGLQDFSHFDPARASRARGIAAKAKVIALAKMGLLRQRMAKEAGTPVEGTQSTGTQCFSFRAQDKVESKPAEGTEGTQSTGTQFFSFSAGDKAAVHPREQRPGSKGEEGACGTSSTGTQVFSFAENDKAAHARERAAAGAGDEGACGTSSTGTQFFSFAENEKAQIHARERAAAGKVDEGASGT